MGWKGSILHSSGQLRNRAGDSDEPILTDSYFCKTFL